MATATASQALPARGRRADILDAALLVFTRRGYHRATIEEIRAVSGASTGSIYHHFDGKEELAAALYVEGLGDYQRRFLAVVEAAGDAEETVKAIVRNHLDWVADNPSMARYLLSSREAEVVRATERELRAMNRAVIEATRGWLAQAKEAGELRAMPAQLFSAVVIGPSQEFARQWLKRRDRAAFDEARAVLADAAWRAVSA